MVHGRCGGAWVMLWCIEVVILMDGVVAHLRCEGVLGKGWHITSVRFGGAL